MKFWSKIHLESSIASLVISILLNTTLLVLTSLILTIDSDTKKNITTKEKPYITVKSYRTVGIKDGSKKGFSTPTEDSGARSSSKGNSDRTVNLSQLAPKGESLELTKPLDSITPVNTKEDKSKFSFSSRPPLKQRLRKQQQQLQGDVLKDLATNPSFADALNNKGFNVQFDPPEGIPEDELNSVEKIFYSFQKRTYEKYLNSFLKTYYSTLTSNPNLKNDMTSSRHRLNARVQFDRNGFIVSVKILKSSESDSVHNLFEKTLDAMRSIPNPPKDLLGKDGNFTIYYSLYIN